MKLNLKKNLLDLEGKAIIDQDSKPILMSRWLANTLAQSASTKENTAQFFSWSMELWKTGMIADIDKSSLEKLKKFINGLDGAPVIIIGQLNQELEKVK